MEAEASYSIDNHTGKRANASYTLLIITQGKRQIASYTIDNHTGKKQKQATLLIITQGKTQKQATSYTIDIHTFDNDTGEKANCKLHY